MIEQVLTKTWGIAKSMIAVLLLMELFLQVVVKIKTLLKPVCLHVSSDKHKVMYLFEIQFFRSTVNYSLFTKEWPQRTGILVP